MPRRMLADCCMCYLQELITASYMLLNAVLLLYENAGQLLH